MYDKAHLSPRAAGRLTTVTVQQVGQVLTRELRTARAFPRDLEIKTPAEVAAVDIMARLDPAGLWSPAAPVARVAWIAKRGAYVAVSVAVIPHARPRAHAGRTHEPRCLGPFRAACPVYAVSAAA